MDFLTKKCGFIQENPGLLRLPGALFKSGAVILRIRYIIDVYAVTSLGQGAIDGPRMPVTLSGSCVVKYNDTSIYILGGIQNYTRSLKDYNDRNVWIASISDEITFSQGPSMLEGRYFHACGTVSFSNKNLIIVAGGMTGGKNSVGSSSVEILDPSTNRWVQGKWQASGVYQYFVSSNFSVQKFRYFSISHYLINSFY